MRDMDERTVVEEEWKNSGTTWTRNSFFEENGYLIIKNSTFIVKIARVEICTLS